MDPTFEAERINRTLAYALRHNPWQFELDLDPEGWTGIDPLVESLRFHSYDWALLDWSQIEYAIRGSDRYEVRDGRIRAAYGHSIALGISPPASSPPDILFHGTTEQALPLILLEGLTPKGRRFVHLTSNREYALRVANSKVGQTVLVVLAGKGRDAGMTFRQANEHVWLTERVDPSYLVKDCEQASA